MIFRAVLIVFLTLAGGLAVAAPIRPPAPIGKPAAAPVAPRTAPLVAAGTMVFYVVRGADDACGPGCNRWIAVEGQVDSSAAVRFKRFLAQVGNSDLPIYLHSPGGNLDQALAMGNMLRERRATARVGRTVVNDCGFEAQDGPACLKLKQSGRELRGDVWTRGATCNSACPYLMLGATTREVAPDAVLAVHSAKVVVHFRGGTQPPAEVRAAANQRGRERADRMVANYIVKMGVDIGLFNLASSIKFESMHVLTREEIVRFGIDRRDVAETGWKFENSTRSMVRKAAVVKDDGGKSWRVLQWRIICAGSDQFELDFQRPDQSAALPAVAILYRGSTPTFRGPPARLQGFEIWAMRLVRTAAQGLSYAPDFQLVESAYGSNGVQASRTAKFSTDGLSTALTSLAETCPAPKSLPPPRQSIGAEASAK
jgi:hypothetical protein